MTILIERTKKKKPVNVVTALGLTILVISLYSLVDFENKTTNPWALLGTLVGLLLALLGFIFSEEIPKRNQEGIFPNFKYYSERISVMGTCAFMCYLFTLLSIELPGFFLIGLLVIITFSFIFIWGLWEIYKKMKE